MREAKTRSAAHRIAGALAWAAVLGVACPTCPAPACEPVQEELESAFELQASPGQQDEALEQPDVEGAPPQAGDVPDEGPAGAEGGPQENGSPDPGSAAEGEAGEPRDPDGEPATAEDQNEPRPDLPDPDSPAAPDDPRDPEDPEEPAAPVDPAEDPVEAPATGGDPGQDAPEDPLPNQSQEDPEDPEDSPGPAARKEPLPAPSWRAPEGSGALIGMPSARHVGAAPAAPVQEGQDDAAAQPASPDDGWGSDLHLSLVQHAPRQRAGASFLFVDTVSGGLVGEEAGVELYRGGKHIGTWSAEGGLVRIDGLIEGAFYEVRPFVSSEGWDLAMDEDSFTAAGQTTLGVAATREHTSVEVELRDLDPAAADYPASLAGALVELSDGERTFRATTSKDGRAVVDVPAGVYSARVARAPQGFSCAAADLGEVDADPGSGGYVALKAAVERLSPTPVVQLVPRDAEPREAGGRALSIAGILAGIADAVVWATSKLRWA